MAYESAEFHSRRVSVVSNAMYMSPDSQNALTEARTCCVLSQIQNKVSKCSGDREEVLPHADVGSAMDESTHSLSDVKTAVSQALISAITTGGDCEGVLHADVGSTMDVGRGAPLIN